MTPLAILAALVAMLLAARALVGETHVINQQASTAVVAGFFLLAAFLAGKTLGVLRLPRVVAYLLLGIVVGPHATALVSAEMVDSLQIVNGVAISLIALNAGGELDFRELRPLLAVVRAITLHTVVGTCVLLTLAVLALAPLLPFLRELPASERLPVALLVGIALTAHSPAVVIALLEETRATGPVSRTMLASVVIADLMVIVLYALSSTWAKASLGGSPDVAQSALAVAWALLGSLAVGTVIGLVAGHRLRRTRSNGALFLFLLSVVNAEVCPRVHLDPLIVMLAAGLVLRNVFRELMTAVLQGLALASLPIYLMFFALTGAGMHLEVLPSLAIPAVILVAVRATGFFAGGRVATRRLAANDPIKRHAWTGLLPQAGLALGLALLIEETFPRIGQAASALCLAVITINELLMPIVMRHALHRSGEAARIVSREAPTQDDRDVAP